MAVSRCQAMLPRRRNIATLISFLQVIVLGSALLVPLPLISAALQSNTIAEEHQESKPVWRPKRMSHRTSLLEPCFDKVPPASAMMPSLTSDRFHRSCVLRPDGHRLANGLLAPLTC